MNRKDLRRILKEEKKYYPCMKNWVAFLYEWLCHGRDLFTWRFVSELRKTEYYFQIRKKSSIYRLLYVIHKRRKNKLGRKTGLDIGENVFGEGLFIAHTDIIAGSASVGKNCRLHG